jgi:hypothetical protein
VLDRRGVTLFNALWAFYQEYCGDLDSAVEGDRVWDDIYVRGGHQPGG